MPERSLWDLVRAGLVIGLIFSPIAAVMAFLITYQEFQHHYPDRARALRHAAHVALITLAAFLGLSLIAGILVGSGTR
jgi:ABC-type enterochelin transport system permease subunit